MRHIPEDELHAYLDQALSRSQCVEIESHLADCPRCQATRDGIAALRDRTTALLAGWRRLRRLPARLRGAAPPGPCRRASMRRRRRMHVAAWAASLVARGRDRLGRGSLLRQEPGPSGGAGAPWPPRPQQTVAVVETTPALSPPSAARQCPAGQSAHASRSSGRRRRSASAKSTPPTNRSWPTCRPNSPCSTSPPRSSSRPSSPARTARPSRWDVAHHVVGRGPKRRRGTSSPTSKGYRSCGCRCRPPITARGRSWWWLSSSHPAR